jgi:hypothetical protein
VDGIVVLASSSGVVRHKAPTRCVTPVGGDEDIAAISQLATTKREAHAGHTPVISTTTETTTASANILSSSALHNSIEPIPFVETRRRHTCPPRIGVTVRKILVTATSALVQEVSCLLHTTIMAQA